MTMDLHPLLLQQIKQLGVDAAREVLADHRWLVLLRKISLAYQEHDQDRYLLERSQGLASQEMATLYAAVRAERDLLESRVSERTEALRLSQARLSSLVSLSADWIWEQDADLRFTYASDGITAVVGLTPAQLLGQPREFDEGHGAPPVAMAAYETALQARQPFRDFRFSLLRPDGQVRHVRISGEPVFDSDGRFCGYRGVGSDVTQATLAEQRVHELARYDSLTGLPNRNLFQSELDRMIARAARSGTSFAICFIDLDRFKVINDTLGHEAGDQLLKVMATRLQSALRETDLVARLGGDEFVVLLEGSDTPTDPAWVAKKLLATMGEAVTLEGREFLVTGSIGIAIYPTDGSDAATLLRHADSAMYLAKDRGKNNMQFYTAELAELATRQFALESELRLAIARNEFVLHYQPKIDILSGQMCGVEALLRWAHPLRGLVAPGEFIGLAEERGLIGPVGRWVVMAACRQIQAWRTAGFEAPSVAINLSARQFASDDVVHDLTHAMTSTGVAPSEVEVELTESALMAEPDRASKILQQLHAMGVRISIDDFGTGYSSLSYLKRFPAHTVNPSSPVRRRGSGDTPNQIIDLASETLGFV